MDSKLYKGDNALKERSTNEDPAVHSQDEEQPAAESGSSSGSESESESDSSGSGSDSSSSSDSSDSSSDDSSDDESSDSDSSSDSGSDSDMSVDDFEKSDDDEDIKKAADSDSDSSDDDFRAFLKDADSGSDSTDEDVRVVRSQKDKKFEEMENIATALENASKINDWNLVSFEFDKLNRILPNVVKQNAGRTPKLYIKTLADIEAAMVEAIEKQKVTPKKMDALKTRGLNATRQKVRKYNKDHTKDIEAYRADPEKFMTETAVAKPAPTASRKALQASALEAQSLADATQTTQASLDGDDGFTVVTSGRAVQYTPESILKHLRTIVESRGRKNTDRDEQVKVMLKLLEIANNDYQRVRTLLTLIPTRFDMASSSSGNHMSTEQWKAAESEFTKLLEILAANPSLVVTERAEQWENDESQPEIKPGAVFLVPGSIASFIERLDDELTRSLQQLDPHTSDYVDRLKDEGALYTSIVRAQIYAERLATLPELQETKESVNRVVVRRLDHIYFKPSQVVSILESQAWEAIPEGQKSTLTTRAITDINKLVSVLCGYLYANSEGLTKTRALLCQIYFLALHDEYYSARDMMLMSHLQELIPSFDVATQILYNRSLVQVGLCAFRAGNIKESQSTLQEICGSSRLKELLAQGLQMQRYSQLSPEQERLEKQRQLPFHMHINLELLECIYLTCSMLLEIPLLAQVGSSPDQKKRVISKTFRRLLEYYERQVFTGHPENTRDHIMQASKGLATGEWRKASELINAIKIWDLMPQAPKIKEFLAKQIQIEGLRTYIFTYAPFYDTLSISILAEMFDLSAKQVSSIVSEMISHEDIRAALDQVTGTIQFSKDVEVSRLQSLASAMSEKAVRLIEANEKVLEQQTGNGGRTNQTRTGGRGPRTNARERRD